MNPAELKAARKALGYSQERLAEALGLTRRQIIRLEGGEQGISRAIELALRYLRAIKTGEL